MGIFVATKVGRGQDNAESRPFTVAEVTADQYNSELVDATDTAFGSTVTAAALQATVYNESLSGSTTVAADVLPIPVTAQVVVKTTGADAEALTLADGTAGQVLHIVLGTDGNGDGTLTPTTSTGWATIVFADAGDRATLKFVDSTVGWIILGLSGVAAPPVTTV